MKRASRVPREWTEEKTRAYLSGESADEALCLQADAIYHAHYKELQATFPTDESRRQLLSILLETLEDEWPVEYLEFIITGKPLASSQAVDELLNALLRAFAAGYMFGRQWITIEQMTHLLLRYGDELSKVIRSKFRHGFARSRPTAFSAALSAISAKGTSEALLALNG